MPTTKKFNARQIGLTKENKEILELWSSIQQKHMKENPIFILALNETDNPNTPVKIKGMGNSICRKLNEFTDWNIGDNGLKIYFRDDEFRLDSDAKLLLAEFEKALVKMAIEIGMSSKMDYDLIRNSDCLQEPFALIKEILIRMVAQAFDVSSGVNANSSKVFTVFKELIIGLSTLSIAEDKPFLFGNPKTSKLNTVLSSNLPKWIEAIDKMIKWINELNHTDNIIQSNLEKLENVEEIIYQHLYYNLMHVKNRGNEVGRNILLRDWVIAPLELLEEEIISKSDNKRSNSIELALLTKKGNTRSQADEDLICSKLQDVSDSDIANIKSLYSALRGIGEAFNLVRSIELLTKDLGCIPFLFNLIGANELSLYIQKRITRSQEACNQACIDNSPLVELTSKIVNCNVIHKSGCDFTELAFPEFIENATKRIAKNLMGTYSLCQEIGCPEVIKWNPQLSISLPQASNSKQLTNNSNKINLIGSTSTQSTSINTHFNHEPIEFEISQESNTKNSFFDVLGLDRNQVMNELLNLLENGDEEIKMAVSLEASLFLQDKSLPQALSALLKPENIQTLEAPRIYLSELCHKFRKALKESDGSSDKFPLNNVRLLEYLIKTNSPLLESHKQEINTYKRLKNTKENSLQAFAMNSEFCLAYFNMHYIEQEGSLIYRPEGCVLLNKLIELKNIPVSFWEKEESGTLTNRNNFNQNLEKNNPVFSRHVLHSNDSNTIGESFYQELRVKEISLKQNKKPLVELLIKVITEDAAKLNDEQKKLIFKKHCVADKALADMNFIAKLKDIEKIKLRLKDYEHQLNLHNRFKKNGLQYVLEQIQTKIQERLNSTPGASIDESLMKIIETQINLSIQTYFYTGLNETYQEAKKTKPQDSHLEILKNGISYVLTQSPSLDAAFLLFLQRKGLCYSDNLDDTYTAFTEITLKGDGDCGFNAMDTDRLNLVNTLKEAIINQDNREILLIEILTYIKVMHTGNSQFWDRSLLTPKMQKYLNNENQLEAEIADLKINLDERLNQYFSIEEWLAFSDRGLDETNKNILDRLKEAFNELNQCCNAISAHCMDIKTCALYIEKFKQPNFWLGKYAAKLYAKQKNIALYVYNKPQIGGRAVSPVLIVDEETSYKPEKSSRSIYIVYENGIHFNKLELIDKENLWPKNQWTQYAASLKQEITKTCRSYQPKIGLTLNQYIEKINNFLRITSAFAVVTTADHDKLISLSKQLEEENGLLELKKQHDSKQENLDVIIMN